MSNEKFEFIRYDAANVGEKFVGIATVKIYGKFIVRVKEIFTKTGTHTFLAAPSVKIGEKFEQAFEIDSKSEQEEFNTYVRSGIAEFKRKVYNPSQQRPNAQYQQTQTNSTPQYHQTSFVEGVPF
jgi:hypothetical protein